MNYFLKGITTVPKKYWLAVAAMSVMAVAIVDAFAAAQGGQLFGGRLMGFVLAAAAIGGLAFLVVRWRSGVKKIAVDQRLMALAAERKTALQRILSENPQFHTFCHECCHFDQDIIGCRLHLPEGHNQFKLSAESPLQHCLYWNFAFPPDLERALLPKRADQSGSRPAG